MACGCANNCSCSTAITIPSGSNGTNGSNGMFGGFSQRVLFDTATSASPLVSDLRMNNVTPSSVTELYVNDLNAESVDINAFLDSFSNNGAYGYVKIWKQYDSNTFWMGKVTKVTDNGADHTINVTYIAHNGTFTDNSSLVISFVGSGSSGVTYFSGNYANLTALVGTLVPGGTYILTDYETKHEVPGTGITNQSVVGYSGVSESIKLTAKDASSFYHKAESLNHPEDEIFYDFNLNTVLGQSRPGLIYWRRNNTEDVEAWFDVRNQTVARYGLDTSSFAWSSDPVNRTSTVYEGVSGKVMQSVRDGATVANFRLVEDISEIDQNLHGNSNVSYFGTTLNYDPSSISYHDCIEPITCTHVVLGKGVNDVLLDSSSYVVIGEESSKISLVNSNDIIIGTKSDQIIVSGSNKVQIGKSSSKIFIYNSQNSKIGHSSSEILIKVSLISTIGNGNTQVLLHSSNECTIGSGCSSLMFIRGSSQNTVGDNCAGISLGNSENNLFDQSCSDIDIFSGGYNRFAQGCNVIGLIGELDDAYTGVGNQDPSGIFGPVGTYYSPYSQMEHNTFGTGCSNITFEILGGRGNQFGDECKNLTFTVGNYSLPWRLVGCHFCRGVQNKTFETIIHGASFLVPNQIAATITGADWMAQILYFRHDTVAIPDVEVSTSSVGGLGAQNGASLYFGYESVASQDFMTPAASGGSGDTAAGAGASAFPASDLTQSDTRFPQHMVQCRAWMWTPEGYPLSMTFTPRVTSLTDSTESLNRV